MAEKKLKHQEIRLEFVMPLGESIHDEMHRPFLEWLLNTLAISRAQGLGCDLYVDGEKSELDVKVVGPHAFQGVNKSRCAECAMPFDHGIHVKTDKGAVN